jgi:hypothetical protein
MYNLCLEEICNTPEKRTLVEERVKEIDPLYFETCFKLIESIKMITYS